MTDEELTRHILHGVLRRWSRSPHAAALVLRGGLMTQRWAGVARRCTRDIDFLGLYGRDLDDTLGRMQTILAEPIDDGLSFDADALVAELIWQETAFAGHRLRLPVRCGETERLLQIDVGFGDPLIPPAEWIDYDCLVGAPVRVQAVRPELLTAWKLHGLFEHGARRWQAKDLYDLHLLTTYCQLNEGTLAEAIRAAFAAHDDSLSLVPEVVYNPAWWQTESSRARWAKFRAGAVVAIPEDLVEVAAAVARALRSALGRLLVLPAQEAIGAGEPG